MKKRKHKGGGSPLRCLADGGSIFDRRRRQLDAIENAAVNGGDVNKAKEENKVVELPKKKEKKKEKKKKGLRGFFGLADGGTAPPEKDISDGGEVVGPGGPTSDKVGPVMISDEEYVLPADTVKAVGKENLDRLRLATHKFVDPKNKPDVENPLRKLADGGTLTPDQKRLKLKQQTVSGINTTRAVDGRDAMKTPKAVANKASIPVAKQAAGVAKKAGGAALGAITGAAESYQDADNGYREHFAKSMGAESPGERLLADTARTMGNVGNAITFGVAERVGQGISNAANGGSFTKGFMAERDRNKFLREAGTPSMRDKVVGTAYASTPQQSMLRTAQQPVTQPSAKYTHDDAMGDLRNGQAPGGGFQRLRQYSDKNNAIYKRGNEYVGIGNGVGASPSGRNYGWAAQMAEKEAARAMNAPRQAGPSRAQRRLDREFKKAAKTINDRYDAMLMSGSSRARVGGMDWSQRHGPRIEQQRARELQQLQNSMMQARGQDLRAQDAAANRDLQNRRMTMDSVLRAQQMGIQGRQAGLRNQAALMKEQNAATKLAQQQKRQQRDDFLEGQDRFHEARSSFLDARFGEDTKQRKRAERWFNRLPAQDQQTLASMDPASQRAAFDAYAEVMQHQDDNLLTGKNPYAMAQNAAVGGILGGVSAGFGLRKGLGYVAQGATELAGTKIPMLRGKGKSLREMIDKSGPTVPIMASGIGATGGAVLTPSRGQETDFAQNVVIGPDGKPVSPSAGLEHSMTHGLWNRPSTMARTDGGGVMYKDSLQDYDTEASRNVLRELQAIEERKKGR